MNCCFFLDPFDPSVVISYCVISILVERIAGLLIDVVISIPEFENYDGIAEDIDIFYSMTKDLANSREFPNWYQNNEFRSIRDNSLINKSP